MSFHTESTILSKVMSFDDGDFEEKMYVNLFGKLGSIILIDNFDLDTKVFYKELSHLFNLSHCQTFFLKKERWLLGKKNTPQLLYNISKLPNEILISYSLDKHAVSIFYNTETDLSVVNSIKELIYKSGKSTKPPREKKKFYMLQGSSGFDISLVDFDVRPQRLSIEDNYNDDFKEIDQIIKKFIQNKNKNGIVLLHGLHGTGKTSYLRYLISNYKQTFIFFPLDMLAHISNPAFLPAISKYKNSILILEDCEKVIIDREFSDNKTAISNLLNLSDGFLGDALNLKIICTFNTKLQKIDKALLRKGRLIVRYEFKELTLEKTIKLAKKLKLNFVPQSPMTLGELYNPSKNDFAAENSSRIGFVK